MSRDLIIVRGGGDLASGTIWTLRKAGFAVLTLETNHPSAIRCTVAFSEAVHQGQSRVEDMDCILARDEADAFRLLTRDRLVMLVDEDARILRHFKQEGKSTPEYHGFRLIALVDAILAKRNLGTRRDMAPCVVALGPGFTADEDCDVVIETMRGHRLGRIIEHGSAIPDTGIPGMIAGHAADRVIHANQAGILHTRSEIGDIVREGQAIAVILDEKGEESPVIAPFTGLLRGLIRDGYPVTKGFKIADIDPREHEYENCFTISDKARCIGGAVLTAILGARSDAARQPLCGRTDTLP
ncbi:MAG: EF2563 family selenium-dependent molybdenum hydroxylase system protein [Clostridiales bacterium]|nr:EF2563 family selenium-dependent molybdenum hydroxylase system protein [Clostridiales bacterium]